MEDQLKNRRVQALQVLAKSAELYLKDSDELTATFVAPQVQGAIQILAQLINEVHKVEGEGDPAPVVEAPTPANGPTPTSAKSKGKGK